MSSFQKLKSLLSSGTKLSSSEKKELEEELDLKYSGKTTGEIGDARIQILMSICLARLQKNLLTPQEFEEIFQLSLKEYRSTQTLFFLLSIRDQLTNNPNLTAKEALSLLALKLSNEAAEDTRATCFANHRLLNLPLPSNMYIEDPPTQKPPTQKDQPK